MNPLKYILATGVLVPSIGVLLAKWRSRVDLDAKKEGQDLATANTIANLPLQLLREELAKRERELADLREQDRQERGLHAETMTAVKKAIEEIATDIRGQREEGRAHASRVHQRIDVLDDRLLVIETQLDVKKRTA